MSGTGALGNPPRYRFGSVCCCSYSEYVTCGVVQCPRSEAGFTGPRRRNVSSAQMELIALLCSMKLFQTLCHEHTFPVALQSAAVRRIPPARRRPKLLPRFILPSRDPLRLDRTLDKKASSWPERNFQRAPDFAQRSARSEPFVSDTRTVHFRVAKVAALRSASQRSAAWLHSVSCLHLHCTVLQSSLVSCVRESPHGRDKADR